MNFSFLFSSRRFFLFLCALLTLLIYAPGLSGDFEFDDSVNILDNSAIKIDKLSQANILGAALSGKSGPLGRSVSMLSFAVNYYFTEFEPFFFKLTNVLIHILAGFGVYAFTKQLTLALYKQADNQRRALHATIVASTTAGIWLVHPLNVTSVLYVVQRMTSLAALFTFWALALYIRGRSQTLEGHHAKGLILILIGLGPMTALAALSKENGLLTPYLILCVELIVFRFASNHKITRLLLITLFSAIVLVPLMVGMFNFDRLAAYVTSGYLQREFSLSDRLLTQPHVLVFYLRMLLLPSASAMGIYHDDFPISSSLAQTSSTLLPAAGIFALIFVGIFAIRRAPALAIGILWFFIGHSLESTFFALEMVHEHRNYLPIVGPIFAAAYYFWHSDFTALAERIKWGTVFAAIIVFSAVTYGRSVEWSHLVDHAAIEAHNHPKSERANYAMGRIYGMLYNNEKKTEMVVLADRYFAVAGASGGSSIFPITARIQLAYKARIEPASGLVEMAAKRLQYGRPWEANMVALNGIVNCQLTQYCRLADSDITTMLFAVLANPHASRKMKASAHSILGGFYVMKLDNYELGLVHMKAAVEVEPDRIEYRWELMRLYEAVGQLEAAAAELESVARLDAWGLRKQKLDEERALLAAALKVRMN